MDFYKLTNFQLYSIINSRHLDEENKATAMREFNRRGLSDEELQKLAEEFAEKNKKISSVAVISPNVILLIAALIFLFLLRQCVAR